MTMHNFSSDHNRLDERSLALHKLVAEKLKADPSLVEIAKENIQRWGTEDRPALKEWDNLLKKGVSYIISFLQERSENATRLRQSSPFAGVLSENERLGIYEAFRSRPHH
jgi:hypothetical protein